MTRPCPCCGNFGDHEPLFVYETTRAGVQSVCACICGMVFTNVAKPIDYADASIYSLPGSYGSSETETDRIRLESVAETVERYCDKSTAEILDVGCARGGLLDALKRRGFECIEGLDPSKACVQETRLRGHIAHRGLFGSTVSLGTFDFITLSHVLEHVEDVKGFLRHVRDRLNPAGRVYIEVPDASRHADLGLPFLEFNSEHINHFCFATLRETLDRNGFNAPAMGEKIVNLGNGVAYPVVWAVAERKASVRAMLRYIAGSRLDMEALNLHIEREMGDDEECIVWGAGEYLCHVAALPVFRRVKIVQVVDRNPMFQGKYAVGRMVEPPANIRGTCPIVIAALTAAPASIKADIEKMNLPNRMIRLEF